MDNVSNPLLSQPDSPQFLPKSSGLNDESDSPKIDNLLPSLDNMIEHCIGGFGWAQFLQAILVSLAWLFDGQQIFITIFADAQPTWHCTEPGTGQNCTSQSNICQLPRTAWDWDKPAYTSFISEWSLECVSSMVTGLPASSFFMGCLLGGFILATLADSSLGRKNMLCLSCLTMSISAFLAVFSTNVWMYSALRFISGFGRATIGASALVLSSETIGKSWRGQAGTVGFFFSTLGFLSLPAMAYISRDSSWRFLYLWTSIPAILYCALVYFLICESPRWLFIQGRKAEALATLGKLSSTNSYSKNILDVCSSGALLQQQRPKFDLLSSIKILVEKKWAFRRLLSVMVAAFGIGIVYYGMPLGLGNLAYDLYLSVIFNALSELPSSLITFFFISRWNRKSHLMTFTITSGVSSIMCAVVGHRMKELQVGMELLSFSCSCMAFTLILIYTLELFPTSVRNSAMAMVRQSNMLSGVFSTILIAAGRENAFWSYGVFGLLILFCGLFVVFLPETKGAALCDTMEEQELRDGNAVNGI